MRRKRDKPIEELHLGWTSTADLEETLTAMFLPDNGQSPAPLPKSASDMEAITTTVTTTPVGSTPDVPLESNPAGITTPVRLTPVETTRDDLTPVETGPAITAGDKSTPVVMVSPAENPAAHDKEHPRAGERTPIIATPVYDGMPVEISGRPYNVYRARLAQDGHSRSEQVLYDILWRTGKPTQADDAFRLVMVSMRHLAEVPALRMTQKNLRIALQRLVEKMAIEEAQTFDPKLKSARVWKVYSYRSILERRKGAGLEWIVRDRGVRFIDPTTTPVRSTPVVMDDSGITTPVRTAETTPVTMATTTPVRTTPQYIGQQERQPEGKQTSSSLVAVTLSREFGFIDDDAIRTLVAKCRQNVPDATDDEIAELATMTARRVVRMRNIDNPVGLLIEQTAKCFLGESFRLFRQAREEQQRRWDELLDTQHETSRE